MTRDEYIKARDEKDFISLAYGYWQENKYDYYEELGKEDFIGLFTIFLQHHVGGFNPKIQKILDENLIRNKVMNYYTEKFG